MHYNCSWFEILLKIRFVSKIVFVYCGLESKILCNNSICASINELCTNIRTNHKQLSPSKSKPHLKKKNPPSFQSHGK